MNADSPSNNEGAPRDSMPTGSRRFATTRWSIVIQAGNESKGKARTALETLCQVYWYPLYAFARRRGQDPESAQDSTQSFFARFLEKHYLGDVDRERGRFRSFLLASFKHFLANEHDRANAKKRGGGRKKLSLDVDRAEQRYALEPRHEITAEKIYDRRWALTVLGTVLEKLEASYGQDGKAELFQALKSTLTGHGSESYRDLGERLTMSEGAVKVAVHRLRRRYREQLRMEISDTVSDPDEVDQEMQHLLDSLQL